MLVQTPAFYLPPLTLQEATETTKIHSVMSKLPAHHPFREDRSVLLIIPSSDAALVGGGGIPQPGKYHCLTTGFVFGRAS